MTETFRIHRASSEPAVAEALADILLDCVEGGASVGFMHPLPRARVLKWDRQLLENRRRDAGDVGAGVDQSPRGRRRWRRLARGE